MVVEKPSQAEEEYFVREEIEKKRRLALQQHELLEETQRQRLKDLHYMHCPKCGMELQEINLRGATVERCFNCQGVFMSEKDLKHLLGYGQKSSGLLRFFGQQEYTGEEDDSEQSTEPYKK